MIVELNTMKVASIVSATAVGLFFWMIVPGYAQHDEKQGEKQSGRERGQRSPEAQEQPKQQQRQAVQQPRQQQQQSVKQAQPQRQRVEQTPQRQRVQAPQEQQRAQQRQQRQQPQAQQRSIPSQPQRTQEQARFWQQQRGWLKQGGWQGHDSFRQGSSRNWASDHRSWAQRGGYGGYYIPQNSFNMYFGSQNFFRLRTVPVMYLGYPRFEYEGTSFLLLDPWPQSWSQDWYASDDVYIDYDDGYYLYDRNYPQQRLAITVVL
ncbi:MAG: hypothetical protein ABI833_19980 [Acidobacteriota bacterium]